MSPIIRYYLNMKKEQYIKNELEDLSPLVSKKMEERKGGLQVPSGFFDTFGDNLIAQIKKEDSTSIVRPITSSEPIKKSSFKWMSIAASILLFLVAGFWMMNQNTSPDSNWAALENMNAKEVLQYLDENMEEIELEDLMDSNIISSAEIGLDEHASLSEADKDLYLDLLLEELTEEI